MVDVVDVVVAAGVDGAADGCEGADGGGRDAEFSGGALAEAVDGLIEGKCEILYEDGHCVVMIGVRIYVGDWLRLLGEQSVRRCGLVWAVF